jgi:hypothetical protein
VARQNEEAKQHRERQIKPIQEGTADALEKIEKRQK